MSVNASRLAHELDTLAEISDAAPPAVTRVVFTETDLRARAFLKTLCAETGLVVREDAVGNMISKEQSARPYPQIGVPEAHHPLSHHGDVPDLVARMAKINRYHTELFAKYLARLRATPDGDGSLLDNTTILYGSGISNSNRHSGDNLPILLLGGGAGRLQGGRHISYTGAPSMANLLVTLMDKMDVPVERLGGSTGKLPIDTVSL